MYWVLFIKRLAVFWLCCLLIHQEQMQVDKWHQPRDTAL